MQTPFPRKARQGPPCPVCGGETLLVTDHPDMFECLDCGITVPVSEDDQDFRRHDDED